MRVAWRFLIFQIFRLFRYYLEDSFANEMIRDTLLDAVFFEKT